MIARKTWREVRGMTIVYLLILELMLVPAIVLWPEAQTLLDRPSPFWQVVSFGPLEDAMSALQSADADAQFRAWMAIHMFFKGVNVVGIACAVLLGTGLIARERENGTLEFLLGRRVRRGRVLWSKFWVVALCVTVPVFLSSWSAIPIAAHMDESLPFGPVTLAAAHNGVFLLMILALTTLFSSFCRLQVHVAFWVGGIVVLNVCVFFINTIRVASVFVFSDFRTYGPILAGNVRPLQLFFDETVWLLAGTAVLYAAAHVAFRRADP